LSITLLMTTRTREDVLENQTQEEVEGCRQNRLLFRFPADMNLVSDCTYS